MRPTASALPSESQPEPLIGVLDLQGDVREHMRALGDVGCAVRRVKHPTELDDVDGLVLPGGESTTLSMLLESMGLFEAIAQRLGSEAAPTAGAGSGSASGALPLFGTCAGLILVAREVLDGRPDQRTFGILDAVVRRNGYGRQAQSFEAELVLGSGEGPLLPTVFIRAPRVVSAGPEVEVLASLDEVPVLVRQGTVLASSFHPELTPDRRVHRLFAEMCRAEAQTRTRDAGRGQTDAPAATAGGLFG